MIERLDGRLDNLVPLADEVVMTGNFVTLHCGRVQILLGHMRWGSVTVQERQLVRRGQKLREVGNSGNTGAPHLHIHAQQVGPPGAIFAADPLPSASSAGTRYGASGYNSDNQRRPR